MASIRRLFTDLVEWKERQDIAREALMEEGRREVATALEVISRDELIWVGEEKGDKNRRAAVFYFDKVDYFCRENDQASKLTLGHSCRLIG